MSRLTTIAPPNPRLKRTRCAPLRSPLNRKTFDPRRPIAWRLAAGLALALFAGALGAGVLPVSSDRAGEIRTAIRRNLHFDFHCLCKAVTPSTVRELMKVASPRDIPTLVGLMGDKDDAIGFGAMASLIEFGDIAVPALQDAAGSPDRAISFNAREALIRIRTLRPNTAGSK